MGKSRKVLYGICTGLAVGTAQGQEKQANNQMSSKPNVLFIIMDDMCDWAHYLGGNNQVITPNLDSLASRGVSFTNAYTAVPLSNPSRTAMLTGIQPFVTGVYNNENVIADFPLANNSKMMPQHFKDNGYTTIISGKIFHTKPSDDVLAAMWDDMTNIDGGYGPWVKNSLLPDNIREQWRDYEAWTGPDTDFPDVVNSKKIIDFIGQAHSKPFFAAMGFYRPHMPWTAPKRYFDLYNLDSIRRPYVLANDLEDIPAYAINNFIGAQRANQQVLSTTGNCWEQLIRAYLACVSFTDDRVGMILDALKKSPYADNTVIVLVGDNGYHHGEKERWGKSALWREACHVPFIIVPPKGDARITKGSCSSVVNLIDIYPTLIDICDLPKITDQLAGKSLMPILSELDAKKEGPSISTYLPGNFTIHADQWNLIKYANNSYELYDVSNDENEFVNLADKAEYASTVDSLKAFLPTSWYSAVTDSVVNSVSVDFSTPEWQAEILRLNPTYVKPAIGVNFKLSSTAQYLGKFGLKGAMVGFSGNPNCVLTGTTHGDMTEAISFRLADTGLGYLEFPTMTSAGTITLHVRNGSATFGTKLALQASLDDDWTTIDSLIVHKSSYRTTSLDEVISYPINMDEPVKLRVCSGDQFINIFKMTITPYNTSGFHLPKNEVFKVIGRKLIVPQPGKVSLYNMLGVLVFDRYVEEDIELPALLGKGVFLVKSGQDVQKIVLNK